MALVCLCVVSGGYIYYRLRERFDFFDAESELESAVSEYRASGMPWEAKDLMKGRTVAPEDNAADLVRKAIAQFDLKKFNAEKEALLDLLDRKQLDAVDRRLAAYAPALEALDPALKRASLDFGRDWDYGVHVELPEYAPIKQLVNTLCIRARLRAARREDAAMAHDLSRARRLTEMAGMEPHLVTMLFRIACERIVNDAVRRCAHGALKSGLERLRQVVERPIMQPQLLYALKGEAYIGIATLRNERSGDRSVRDPFEIQRSGLPSNWHWRGMMVRHLQVWTRAKREMDRFANDPIALGSALNRIEAELSGRRGASYALAEIMFPHTQAVPAAVALHADRVATAALLQALLVRADTGQLPDLLADIPGEWIDPFSRKPLLLRRKGDSILIYSVGPDGRDDGGVPRRKGDDLNGWDVVASHPPLPKRD
ncbi:MAG: hypothetical protein ACR2HJ_12560 [Fimbriimonadales bacterium]